MGHERVGLLPSTKRWQAVVTGIADFSNSNDTTASLASTTMRNVATRFTDMQHDEGVISSFSCLLLLVEASKQSDPIAYLSAAGLPLSPGFSLLELARTLKQYQQANAANRESGTFASQALLDTVRQWTQQQQSQQLLAFSGATDAFDPWRKAASPAGFSELTHLFFGTFLSRFLGYFLEREASARITTLADREIFSARLQNHTREITATALDTAKVTQSFAAGWYTNHAKKKLPTQATVERFLGYALTKLSNTLIHNDHVERR